MKKGFINYAMKKVYENLGLSTKFVNWKAKLCLLN